MLGIYYKLQTFIYLTANGIVQGMRPIIGFNYGAGEHKRVRKIYEITLIMCAVIMLIGTGICLAIPEQLIGLFSSNPETIRLGGQALTRISVGFLISAVSITSSGALEGLGKGGSSLIISLCRNVIVILPAAYLLSHLGGGVFVWHASGSQRSFPQRFLLWYTAAQYEDKKYKKKRKAASCGRRLFFL